MVLGRIAGPFGVQGWLKVSSYTDPPDNILDYEVWQIGGPGKWSPVRLEEGRLTGKGVQVKLEGVESPEDARTWVGREIGVWRSELPRPPPASITGPIWKDLRW